MCLVAFFTHSKFPHINIKKAIRIERSLTLDEPVLSQFLLSHGKTEKYIFLYHEGGVTGDLGQLKDGQRDFIILQLKV